jgi:hypothetical protein
MRWKTGWKTFWGGESYGLWLTSHGSSFCMAWYCSTKTLTAVSQTKPEVLAQTLAAFLH